MKQEEAFNLLKMGKNIFLTGAAGSGKTYLLNKYIRYLKDHDVGVAITASTGIAATHLYGTTIHAWSGIGVKRAITTQDLEKLLTQKYIKRNYQKTKVLIIDEISMLHQYQLDMVDVIARYILNSDAAFGGMQLVLCGDFFQLPPVSMGPVAQESLFAFEAASWKNANVHVCYLSEQHRQGNDPLLNILNDIRSGSAGEHTKVPLRTRYKKEPQGAAKATRLYARNINVDAINERELASIRGQERTYTMATEGFKALVESLKKNCLAQAQLKLKIGAEVMFIKNDATGRYVNGTRGVVVGFDVDDEGSWPVVRTYNRKMITASPEAWQYEENGIVRATITQVPLRLAWALTIHKSQGMTLDAVELDLGDVFEPGMGYVALSRVRSLAGLKLMNLNEMALRVHPEILAHDHVFKNSSVASQQSLHALSEQEIARCHSETLKRFQGSGSPRKAVSDKITSIKAEVVPTHMITLKMLKEHLSIEVVAAKRALTVETIINHIEKLKGLRLLDSALMEALKGMLLEEDFGVIFVALAESTDGALKPIYDKFEARYSYANIRLVRLFVG